MQASRGKEKYKKENLFINVSFVKLQLERHIMILETFNCRLLEIKIVAQFKSALRHSKIRA